MTDTIAAVSKIAERSSSTTLMSIGGGLLVFAFGLQVAGRLAHSPPLSTGEFVAILIVSAIILLAGAAIRVYQSDKGREAGKLVKDAGVQLVEKGMDIGAILAQKEDNQPD